MKRDLVLEDLQRAKREMEGKSRRELEEEHRKTKRLRIIFLRVVAVLLVLLMLSFIYLSAPVYTFIYGFAGSSRVVDNEITFRNEVTVFFDEETLAFLQELYDPLGDERAVCIRGEIKDDEYFVEDYYKPRVFERAWNMVSHEPCDEDTIIMLHTHPFKRCAPSRTDENTLRITQSRNPEIIMLVMCGTRRFSAVI